MSARYLAAAGIALSLTLAAAVPGTHAQGFGFATFSASVNASGQTGKSSGVKKSKRNSLGHYTVTFTRKITSCVYVASPQGTSGGQASATKAGKSRVRVDTFASNGVRANLGFTLLVSCI